MMISELTNNEIITRSESCCTADGAMTDAEAQRMREVVGTSEWSDHNTNDIPEAEWLRMLAEACGMTPDPAHDVRLLTETADTDSQKPKVAPITLQEAADLHRQLEAINAKWDSLEIGDLLDITEPGILRGARVAITDMDADKLICSIEQQPDTTEFGSYMNRGGCAFGLKTLVFVHAGQFEQVRSRGVYVNYRDKDGYEMSRMNQQDIDDAPTQAVGRIGRKSAYGHWIPNTYTEARLVFFVSGDNGDEFGQYPTRGQALDRLKEVADSGELSEEETQLIAQAATQVAGAIFEDTAGEHIEDRLQAARKWQNQGADADLTSEDRIALDLLHDAATGITSDLTDAETNDVIRNATIEEACQSAVAINGIILVDGRRAYVAQ
tara:strand:- start:448 stop:1590 length:1143 start_codon:yes stop_codon:yes gene_type:complete